MEKQISKIEIAKQYLGKEVNHERIEASMTAYHKWKWKCGCECEYTVGFFTEWKGFKACSRHKFLEDMLNKDKALDVFEKEEIPKFIQDFLRHIAKLLEKVRKNVLKNLKINVTKTIIDYYVLRISHEKKDIALDVEFDSEGNIKNVSICPAITYYPIAICSAIYRPTLNQINKFVEVFVNELNKPLKK